MRVALRVSAYGRPRVRPAPAALRSALAEADGERGCADGEEQLQWVLGRQPTGGLPQAAVSVAQQAYWTTRLGRHAVQAEGLRERCVRRRSRSS